MNKSQIIIAVALSAMLLVGCKHKEEKKSLPDYSETPLTVDTYRELILQAKQSTLGEGSTVMDNVGISTSLVNSVVYKVSSFFYETALGSEKSVFYNPEDEKYYDYENHSVFTSSNHYREIDLNTFESKMEAGKQRLVGMFNFAFDTTLAVLNGTSEEFVNPTIKFAKLSGGRKEMIVKAKYMAEEWDSEQETTVEVEKTKTLTVYIKNGLLNEFEIDGGPNDRRYQPSYGNASYSIPAKPQEDTGA